MKKISTFASLMRDFCCIFFFLIVYSSFSFAYPQVGHQFYGYAGSGDTVTAAVGDISYTASIDSDGYYGYDPLFFVNAVSDDMDGAEEGDTITFYLDDTKMTTYTFTVGGVTKLDFADDPATTTTEGVAVAEGDADGDGILDSIDSDDDNDGIPDSSDTDDDNDGKSDDEDTDDRERYSSKSKKKITKEVVTADTGCYDKWTCTTWSACAANGFQTRLCYYAGNCTTEGNKSDTRQYCTYIPLEEEEVSQIEEEESCSDSIQNQGERGVDCGGPCPACEEVVPTVAAPKTNWWYIALGIFLILLIIAIIFAHKYKDKLELLWEKFKNKFRKKTPVAATTSQSQQRPAYSQQYGQYRPQQWQQYKR